MQSCCDEVVLFSTLYSLNACLEPVGDYCNAGARAEGGVHLDQLPLPLEVLAQHQGRRLAHHRVPDPEEEAVAEKKKKETDNIKEFLGVKIFLMHYGFARK